MNANYSPKNCILDTKAYTSVTSDYKRNKRQEMLIAPPLDLSFKEATTMEST